jgi:hypothetical protein
LDAAETNTADYYWPSYFDYLWDVQVVLPVPMGCPEDVKIMAHAAPTGATN